MGQKRAADNEALDARSTKKAYVPGNPREAEQSNKMMDLDSGVTFAASASIIKLGRISRPLDQTSAAEKRQTAIDETERVQGGLMNELTSNQRAPLGAADSKPLPLNGKPDQRQRSTASSCRGRPLGSMKCKKAPKRARLQSDFSVMKQMRTAQRRFKRLLRFFESAADTPAIEISSDARSLRQHYFHQIVVDLAVNTAKYHARPASSTAFPYGQKRKVDDSNDELPETDAKRPRLSIFGGPSPAPDAEEMVSEDVIEPSPSRPETSMKEAAQTILPRSAAEKVFQTQEIVDMVVQEFVDIKEQAPKPAEARVFDHDPELQANLRSLRTISKTFARAGEKHVFKHVALTAGFDDGVRVRDLENLSLNPELAKYVRSMGLFDSWTWQELGSQVSVALPDSHPLRIKHGQDIQGLGKAWLAQLLSRFKRLEKWHSDNLSGPLFFEDLIEMLAGSERRITQLQISRPGAMRYCVSEYLLMRSAFDDEKKCKRTIFFSNIRSLSLSSSHGEFQHGRCGEWLSDLVRLMPNLESLELANLTLYAELQAFDKAAKLRSLSLKDMDVPAAALAASLRNSRHSLIELHFKNVSLYSKHWDALLEQIEGMLPELRTVALEELHYVAHESTEGSRMQNRVICGGFEAFGPLKSLRQDDRDALAKLFRACQAKQMSDPDFSSYVRIEEEASNMTSCIASTQTKRGSGSKVNARCTETWERADHDFPGQEVFLCDTHGAVVNKLGSWPWSCLDRQNRYTAP